MPGVKCDIMKWRMASTIDKLDLGLFYYLEIPPVIQWHPTDHSRKSFDADGGTFKDGYWRYEMLWTKLTWTQFNRINKILYEVPSTATRLLYLTAPWYEQGGFLRYVDLGGYPDIGDVAPDPPWFSRGEMTFSSIRLVLNNVTLVRDPAVFS